MAHPFSSPDSTFSSCAAFIRGADPDIPREEVSTLDLDPIPQLASPPPSAARSSLSPSFNSPPPVQNFSILDQVSFAPPVFVSCTCPAEFPPFLAVFFFLLFCRTFDLVRKLAVADAKFTPGRPAIPVTASSSSINVFANVAPHEERNRFCPRSKLAPE